MDDLFSANPVAPQPEAILSHSQLLADLRIAYFTSKPETGLPLRFQQTKVLGEIVEDVVKLLLTSLEFKLVKQLQDEFKFLIL